MALRRMWLLMGRRMRDAGEGNAEEIQKVVRECKTMADEDARSYVFQLWRQVYQMNQANWKKARIGMKRKFG